MRVGRGGTSCTIFNQRFLNYAVKISLGGMRFAKALRWMILH